MRTPKMLTAVRAYVTLFLRLNKALRESAGAGSMTLGDMRDAVALHQKLYSKEDAA